MDIFQVFVGLIGFIGNIIGLLVFIKDKNKFTFHFLMLGLFFKRNPLNLYIKSNKITIKVQFQNKKNKKKIFVSLFLFLKNGSSFSCLWFIVHHMCSYSVFCPPYIPKVGNKIYLVLFLYTFFKCFQFISVQSYCHLVLTICSCCIDRLVTLAIHIPCMFFY